METEADPEQDGGIKSHTIVHQHSMKMTEDDRKEKKTTTTLYLAPTPEPVKSESIKNDKK